MGPHCNTHTHTHTLLSAAASANRSWRRDVMDSPSFQVLDGEADVVRRLVLHLLHHPPSVLKQTHISGRRGRCSLSELSVMTHLLLLLLLVVVLLLLALRDQVVQPAQLSLGEAEVQKLPDEHQSQNLQRMPRETSYCLQVRTQVKRVLSVVSVRLTIMGKTTAAAEALMVQRTMRQDSCTTVKTWTFHRGT